MSAPISADRLTAALVEKGVVRADATPVAAVATAMRRPWFIGMMLGIAGWLAGACTLVFVAQVFTPSTATAFAVLGSILLGAAFALYAVDREGAFLDQFALALSIAGQLAFAWAFHKAVDSQAGTALLVFLMQCVLLVAMPNRTARLLAALFACIAWALVVRFGLWDHNSYRAPHPTSLGLAFSGWCAAWLPVLASTWALVWNEARWMADASRRFLRPLLIGMLLSLSLGTIVSSPMESFDVGATAAGHTNWLALWPLLAMLSALFAGFCAFRIRNNALLGVAIAGALLHVMHFYLLLGVSLLSKSVIMLAMGAVFLAGSAVLNRRGKAAPR